MKSRRRLIFSMCFALLAGTCLSAPSFAQKGDAAALSIKIRDLGRAGKYAEAVALALQQVESLEKKYGPAHRDFGSALSNLGYAYANQGRDGEAEPLYKRAIAILEKTVGTDSPEVAATLTNLAALYQRQQRHAEAEPLFKRALVVRERSLPSGHTDLGQSLNNLATHYEKLGRHGDSEPLFKRALAIYEKAAGPDNPAVATLLNNLGQVTKVQRRFAEAEPLIRRSLAIREKVLGREHPDVARSLNNLADLYERQGRYAKAQPLFERALTIRERAVGPDHPDTANSTNNLAVLYQASGRAGDALPLVERLIGGGRAQPRAALPVLADAERQQLIPREKAVNDMLAVIQRGTQSSAASAVNKLAVRLAAGSDRLAELVRRDQDLASEADTLDKSIVAAVSKERSKRDDLGKASDASGKAGLFDLALAHELYGMLLAPVDALIKDKPSLLVASSGALTALPFHLLVTEKPAAAIPESYDGYRDAAWLLKRQAVSVLPSAASLKALRVFAVRKEQSTKPMTGFGDPIFNPAKPADGNRATRTAARSLVTGAYTDFWKGAGVDRARLSEALAQLPDTADELNAIGKNLGVAAADIHLGEDASESTLKRTPLADYGIVYFATHGLVAGDVKGLAEPSLVLSIPRQPSEFDDGLLTASEVAQLKLNADWVVLSACNTIAGDKPGAEALSGLARSFFYAGARALLVSHWAVSSEAATRLAISTFDRLKADAKLGRAEALRQAMLAYLNDASSPRNAYPAFWAPFALIGEGAAR
jgi:CHAT domain-containing protein